MRKALWFLVRVTGLSAVTVCGLLLGCQSRLMYHPRPYDAAGLKAWRDRGGEVLEFTTGQGIQTAFYLPPPSGDAATARWWLFVAGNASLALDVEEALHDWDAEAGWLLVDFPGYGACQGQPNPATMAESLTGAVDALAARLGTTRAALASRGGAAGHSLGAAAALIAADDLSLSRAVLFSPFTSMTDMGRLVVGWPLCYLNRHPYDNRKRLDSLARKGARVWIIHGTEDEVIPVRMARDLAAAHPEAIRFREVAGARHNDLLLIGARPLRTAFQEATP